MLCERDEVSDGFMLQRKLCGETGREYICCDENKTEDGHRSPFLLGDTLQGKLNCAFDVYTRMYYENEISSCYVAEKESLAATIVIQGKYEHGEGLKQEKKAESFLSQLSSRLAVPGVAITGKKKTSTAAVKKALWQSIHHVAVGTDDDKTSYTNSSSFQIFIQTEGDCFSLNVGVTETNEKRVESESREDVVGIGRVVEEAENRLRMMLGQVYVRPLGEHGAALLREKTV
ncbi:MAG: F-actin capping protein beta subunit [Amphiamblys sp. WSBS2006]|nr:MAG: F-actin capping protein beta subunit [Amphiamblys sp. WSBS2006]